MARRPQKANTSAPEQDNDRVNAPTLAYKRMEPDWLMVRTLWGGTGAMRRAGKLYLPKETVDGFRVRLERSVLFNAYKRTVKTLVGKPFSKKPALGEDVPADIKPGARKSTATGAIGSSTRVTGSRTRFRRE